MQPVHFSKLVGTTLAVAKKAPLSGELSAIAD